MGFKFKVSLVLWAMWVGTGVYGQCTESSHCPEGYYCEETSLQCQKCLNCEDYKRESPPLVDDCVKSVIQCGNCFEGLVEDLRMDRACVPPLSPETGEVLPTYVWAIIGLALLALILIIIFYLVFKKDTLFQYILKIRATTSVHSTRDSAGAAPSAPELAPPPYDELYARPLAPPAPPAPAPAPAPASRAPAETHVVDEDASRPFIKRVPSARARGARESADSQAARPFNNPAYIRGPDASYIQHDESEPAATPPFTPHDEDTMESLWTPNENSNNIVSNSSNTVVTDGPGEVEGAVGGARSPSPTDEGPPAKALCIREDTNNNRGRESGGAGAGSTHAPTVVISVVNNFNSFEQRNNLNLPRH